MARWKAKCWLGSKNGFVNLEVESATFAGAREQMENIYGAEQVINLRQISSSNSSDDSSINVKGYFSLIKLGLFFALLGAAFAYLPIVSSATFGFFGAKLGLKIDTEKTIFKNINNNFISRTLTFIISVGVLGSGAYIGTDFLENKFWADEAQSTREFFNDLLK